MAETRHQRIEGKEKSATASKKVNTCIDNANDEDAVDHTFCLLDLPIELQTMIYEHAVMEPDKIFKLHNVKTPPLARVNRMLRKMVIPIFLNVNAFSLYTEQLSGRDFDVDGFGFNIREETLSWLCSMGVKTPLFKHIVVHFGEKCSTEIQFKCDRREGLRMTHEDSCPCCHLDSDSFPPITDSIIDELPHPEIVKRIVGLVEMRDQAMAAQHNLVFEDIKKDAFGKVGGLDKKALGLSLKDIQGIERVLSIQNHSFGVAVQKMNKDRGNHLPLIATYKNQKYELRRTNIHTNS